ncbi:MAG: hypothetical protein KIG36_02285 [Eubacteriales bacterium]|nr:hypothetical protein [Eubacteriales bacterium]
MRFKTVYASEVAVLDSNVATGGGTDDTAALQAVLDEAADPEAGVRLVMDGAALVSGLVLYSDTTIECLDRECGFYQIDGSDRALVANAHWSFDEIVDRNITLVGGTYNQNAPHQRHHVPAQETGLDKSIVPEDHWIFAFEFYGVEFLTMRDLVIADFRTFSTTIGNFRNVLIENVWLTLPHKMHWQNQDGFHFWGPGQFLTVRNVGGDVGDDFMNIGPDERDLHSSISDVLVDGVMLDHADQAIRLLSRYEGSLDRVTIRNVTGTYNTFGFYVNCWMPSEKYGRFRNIFFENIDLRAEEPVYDYREPFLFSIGGNVEDLTIRNVRHHDPYDARPLIELGLPFYETDRVFPPENMPRMKNVVVEGLSSDEGPAAKPMDYIRVFEPVDRLVLRDVFLVRDETTPDAGHLIAFRHQGAIGTLYLNDVVTNGFASLIDDPTRVGRIRAHAVVEE